MLICFNCDVANLNVPQKCINRRDIQNRKHLHHPLQNNKQTRSHSQLTQLLMYLVFYKENCGYNRMFLGFHLKAILDGTMPSAIKTFNPNPSD